MGDSSQEFHAGAATARLPALFQSLDGSAKALTVATRAHLKHWAGWTDEVERSHTEKQSARNIRAGTSVSGAPPQPPFPADWFDPLLARAVVLECLGETVAIVGVDMVGVLNGSREGDPRTYITTIRQRARSELGIKHVQVVATHNHSSWVDDVTYEVDMVNQILKAIKDAQSNLVPAEIGIGWGLAREGFNRVRCPTPHGTEPRYYVTKLSLTFGNIESYDDISNDHSNQQLQTGVPPQQRVPNTTRDGDNDGEPLDKDYYRGLCANDLIDDEVGVVRIRNKANPKQTVATLVNYAAHAAMLGSARIVSTEWPGRMMNSVNSRIGGVTIFLQGAAGDVDTWFTNGALDPSGAGDIRAIAEMNGTGERIADEVIRVARSIQQYSTPKSLRAAETVPPLSLPDPGYSTYGGLGGRPRFADLGAVTIGDSLAMGFLPGEYFTYFGLRLKRESELENTFFVGYANDHIGYLPTDDAFDHGQEAYGTTPAGNRGVVRGTGDVHVDEVLSLLKKCAPPPPP